MNDEVLMSIDSSAKMTEQTNERYQQFLQEKQQNGKLDTQRNNNSSPISAIVVVRGDTITIVPKEVDDEGKPLNEAGRKILKEHGFIWKLKRKWWDHAFNWESLKFAVNFIQGN